MKKVIFILIINFMALHFSFGQCEGCVVMYDIQTPKGTTVETLLCCESYSGVRAYFDSLYLTDFPDAIPIPLYEDYYSTSKFQCHGYAWIRVDQGIDRWLEIAGVGTFVTDGSYVEVASKTYPGKILWTNIEHSGITTADTGWVVSKWELGPLFKHRLNYSPYGTSPTLKYYVKNCGNTGIPIIVLENQTITTNQTYAACNITVKNVTVSNGAKLILDADEETNIISNFEVQLGSELEIK